MKVELEKLLNTKESRARDLLRYLVKSNMLQKIGATRNIRYIKTVGKKIKQRKSLRNHCLKIIDYFCICDNLIY